LAEQLNSCVVMKKLLRLYKYAYPASRWNNALRVSFWQVMHYG
jgi:hypothetical protein